MKKINLIIFSLLLSSSLLMATSTTSSTVNSTTDSSGATTTTGGTTNAAEGTSTGLTESETKSKITEHSLYPMTENLIESTAWPLILKELEISLKTGECGTGLEYAIGLKAHMIEPVGYYERVNKPLNFPFMGISLDGNPILTNTPFESNAAGGDTPKTQATNSHFIYVPILGLIFEKSMSFWCLHKGPITIPYLSEFDPTYKQDFMYMKMIPQMIAMFSPDTLISTIFDCASTEIAGSLYGNIDLSDSAASNEDLYLDEEDAQTAAFDNGGVSDGEKPSTLDRYKSNGMDAANMIRNSMYFIDGCNGFSPVGGYQDGNDPVTDGHNDWHGMNNILQGASALTPISILEKQSSFGFTPPSGMTNGKLTTIVDTMCKPAELPLPMPSQYNLQLAYPLVGGAKEMGSSGASTSTGKNLPGAEGVVFVIWIRRDYYAFAYFCPGAGK